MEPMRWTFDSQSDYLLFLVRGEWIFRSVHTLIEEIRDACRQTGSQRVLVDMRSVMGLVPEEDRYRAGVEVADMLRNVRLAVVVPELYPNRFAEAVANRRGATMRVGINFDEGLRWLLGED